MSLFDNPNDMQWQSQINNFRRSSNETLIGKIVDEHGDGNYRDNMFQKYTVELLGWGQKLYNCKVKIDSAGYNGTGDYRTFKEGDGVLIQCKEGQLDDAIIIGSHRLNGDLKQLEQEGQGQKFGEHYTGAKGKIAASSPPSLHPGRVTKVEGNVFIGGINNARTSFEDPAQIGSEKDCLDKQPIPGTYKAITKEGVDVNYSYGGTLHMTDGNYVVLSSGTRQNKCTKYLEQASRHNKIASYLEGLSTFVSSEYRKGAQLSTFLDSEEDLNLDTKTNTNFSITNETNLVDSVTGKPFNSTNTINKEVDESRKSTNVVDKLQDTDEVEKPESEQETKFAIKATDNSYRATKHKQLALIAKSQAEECNTTSAAFQYSSAIVGAITGTAAPAQTSVAPAQKVGHVDPNNYSSRNTSNPKPPVEFVGCHANNYSKETHVLKYLVMHHSVENMEKTIELFNDPTRKASAHYGVDKDGKILQFVKDLEKAYHVGGQNTGKIGIEIIATEPNQGMSKEQEESLIKLSRFIVSTYKIALTNVKGHNVFNPPTPTNKGTECPTWVFPTQAKLEEWANKYLKV